MRHVASAVVSVLSIAAVLGAPRLASAEEVKIKGPWDGLGVGSFVHQKTTTKMSGVAGMPEMPPQVSESKQTLVKITDEAYIVKNETKMGEEWQGMEIPYPRKATAQGTDVKSPKPEELGDEKVTVDGTDIACKKMRMKTDASTTTSWTNEKYGLVKSETTSAGMTMSILLTKLSVKTKVGTADVDCRELTSTSKGNGMEMKSTSLYSDAVPGGTVRSESVNDMPGGMKTTSVLETVSFEKK